MHMSFFHSLYMIFVSYFFIKVMKMYKKKSCTYCEHKIMSYFLFLNMCMIFLSYLFIHFLKKYDTKKSCTQCESCVNIVISGRALWFARRYSLSPEGSCESRSYGYGVHLTSFYLIIVQEKILTLSKIPILGVLFGILKMVFFFPRRELRKQYPMVFI